MVPQWIYTFFILPLFAGVYSYAAISIGPQAQIICRSYRKVCEPGRFCAMQHYTRPRNITLPVCVPDQIKLRLPDIPVIKDSPCYLQKVEGPCRARFIRWFFDANEEKCKWFYYGGCGHNKNNFKSRSICEKACPVKPSVEERDNRLRRRPPVVLPVRSAVKLAEPGYLADRSSPKHRSLARPNLTNSVSRKELRPKSRMRRRDKRRLQKLKRMRRRLLRKEKKKKRRDGSSRRHRGRKRKNRKNRRGRRKNRKKKRKNKSKKHKSRQEVVTMEPTSSPLNDISTKGRSPLIVLDDVDSESTKNNDSERT